MVKIDHASLRHLWHQKIHSQAQHKWLHKLMGYDFIIKYKKGIENSPADALARCSDESTLLAISQPIPIWLDSIKKEVTTDPALQDIIVLIKAN